MKEELLWVAGVTPEMFDKIKNQITVYGEGVVNVNTADVPVLVSLGLDKELAEKVVRFRDVPSSRKDDEIPEGVFTDDVSIADLLSKTESLSRDEIVQIQRVLPLLGVRSNNFKGNVLGFYLREGRAEKIVFVYDRKEQILKSWREG